MIFDQNIEEPVDCAYSQSLVVWLVDFDMKIIMQVSDQHS